MKRNGEDGFFLLETLIVGLALLVMSAGFYLYADSMKIKEADGCRVRAAFLARTQFSAAQAEADRRDAGNVPLLKVGTYPWQGRNEDLQDGDTEYQVFTEIGGNSPDEEGKASGIYDVSVQVNWQGKSAKGEMKLTRTVVAHGKEG